MKKTLTFLLSLFFILGSTFAQDASELLDDSNKVDTSTRVIVPEEPHTSDKTASVRIEYQPMIDEVRIYYTCMYVTYDHGEAMNSILACLADFQKENQYFNYKYMERDRERYFKNERGYNMAQYISHVKFSR